MGDVDAYEEISYGLLGLLTPICAPVGRTMVAVAVMPMVECVWNKRHPASPAVSCLGMCTL